jgi:hypothetical protein
MEFPIRLRPGPDDRLTRNILNELQVSVGALDLLLTDLEEHERQV